MRTWAVTVAAILAMAAGAEAGGFAPVTTEPAAPVSAASPTPTPLEWLRLERPMEGRDVLVQSGGATLRWIEWHRDNEVRVRTESGALLTPAERAAVRALALVCRRGEVRDPSERVEFNGTYVVEYSCAWLQGSQ